VSFGFVYSRDIFCVEGFPLQRPDWRVIYCNGLLYVFPTHNIVNVLINFTFLTETYLSKAQYSLFVLKVLLNPNQSTSQSLLNLIFTLKTVNYWLPQLTRVCCRKERCVSAVYDWCICRQVGLSAWLCVVLRLC